MKAAPNLDFAVMEPTKKSLEHFVGMIRKVYQNFIQVLNGQIGFGDGTNLDNINGSWINVTAPVAPNTDFTVNHNMNRIPSGYWVMQKDRACDVYTGSVAATATQLTLRASVASAVLRLFVIALLLGLFAGRGEAQGANHSNIALKNTTVSGSSGIGGGSVLQAINGASITVCSGSTLPAAGATCTGLASIFSNRALTTVLVNPFNADTNGNYFFWATPGPYVVSVGGAGLTTYSYAATLACNPTDTCTFSGGLTASGATLPTSGITLLNAQANAAAIVGTGSAATIYTYTLPAATVANLKGIRFTAGVNHSTGTASVAFVLSLNGQTVISLSSSSTGIFNFYGTVLNTGATTGTTVNRNEISTGGSVPSNGTLTGLAWASNQILTLTFNVAATDQVTPIQWVVELIQ